MSNVYKWMKQGLKEERTLASVLGWEDSRLIFRKPEVSLWCVYMSWVKLGKFSLFVYDRCTSSRKIHYHSRDCFCSYTITQSIRNWLWSVLSSEFVTLSHPFSPVNLVCLFHHIWSSPQVRNNIVALLGSASNKCSSR